MYDYCINWARCTKVPNRIIDNRDLSLTEKLCYMILLALQQQYGCKELMISHAELAEFMCLSRRQIGRIIKTLEETELIKVRREPGMRNWYTLMV